MDLQKKAPSDFSLRPISGKNIASAVIEDLVDILIAQGIYRIIPFDIRSAPTGERGGLSEERPEAFFCGGIASEIGVEDFEGFGIQVELAPRHHLSSLLFHLHLLAFLDTPDGEGHNGQDGAAYNRRNEYSPVASLTFEP